MLRVRILPVTIFVAALLLTVKVGDLRRDIARLEAPVQVASAEAQQQQPQPAAKPAPEQKAAREEKPIDPVLFTRSEIEILQELSARRRELDQREQAMIEKEGLLRAAEARIENKISEFRTIRQEIEALIKKYDEQQEKELRDLVKIYESMKPKDAARIFDQLEMKILIEVIERMKANKTAPVLAEMNPKRATELTTLLAERRQMPKLDQSAEKK